MKDPNLYPAHRIYQFLALIGVAVALLFVWTLARDFEWMTFLFFAVAVTFSFINLRWMFTRAELTPSGLTLHEPLNDAVHVDFRQMVAVYEAGRVVPGVSLVYYPLRANGLVDMDDARSLFLPALERQDELLSVLSREIPE